MSRPLRISYPGAFYHVTSRGNERKNVFLSEQDRKRFLDYLESANEKYGAIIHCYCLMNNHYHLLLETSQANLPQVMHQINASYTTYFNTKRSRSGHLFQGRYKAILVDKESYALELSRYIHMNPVRVKSVENPWEYKWSSCGIYTGIQKAPSWLETSFILKSFGRKPYDAYRSFVVKDNAFSPYKQIHASTILGPPEFITRVQKYVKGENIRDVPALKKVSGRPALESIEKAVSEASPDDIRRKMCLYISQAKGYSLKEIGVYFNMRSAAVSQSNLRFKARMRTETELKKLKDRIEKRSVMSNV
jgi:REP element-mobilizing transposase RayT